jgi:hypothetical protein
MPEAAQEIQVDLATGKRQAAKKNRRTPRTFDKPQTHPPPPTIRCTKKRYKKRSTKQIASKGVYKKFDQKSKTDFFSILFSSMSRVQKHD